LRDDFATFRSHSEQLRTLVETLDERIDYQRTMAEGLQQVGEYAAAFEHYRRLIDLDPLDGTLKEVAPFHAVRTDLLVRAGLSDLYRQADAAARETIDQYVATRVEEAVDDSQVDTLRRLLFYLGQSPAAEPARAALLKNLAATGGALEAELRLWDDYRGADAQRSAKATAELARLLDRTGRRDDARVMYDQLRRRWADVVCLEGKTGAELIAALPDDHPARQPAPRSSWPVGRVTAGRLDAERPTMHGQYPLQYLGDPGPFFEHTSLLLDRSHRTFLVLDGLGRTRMTTPLKQLDGPFIFRHDNRGDVATRGHLMVVRVGNGVVAVDGMTKADTAERVLWSFPDAGAGTPDNVVAVARGAMGGRMGIRMAIQINNRVQFGGRNEPVEIGPVTHRYVALGQKGALTAIDPLSGKPLWIREDFPRIETIFGDEEFVIVAQSGDSRLAILRADDGSDVGTTDILPSWPGQDNGTVAGSRPFGQVGIGTLDRRYVLSHTDGRHRWLGLYDPVEKQFDWGPIELDRRAEVARLGATRVGALEPDGRFRVLRLEDGRVVVDQQLDNLPNVDTIHLVRAGSTNLLIAGNRHTEKRLAPMPGVPGQIIGRGHVHAFDSDGKWLWPKPVEVEAQMLAPGQPELLPVFCFASRLIRKDPNQQGRSIAVTQVLCLDKRTGRVLLDHESDQSSSTFAVTGDPKSDTVDIHLQRQGVRLTFTDEPWPAENEASAGIDPDQKKEPKKKDSDSAAGALLKALGGALAPAIAPGGQPGLRIQIGPGNANGPLKPIPAPRIARPAELQEEPAKKQEPAEPEKADQRDEPDQQDSPDQQNSPDKPEVLEQQEE
jgi:hypothetical protein